MRAALRNIAINIAVFAALLVSLNILAIALYQGLQTWRSIVNPPEVSDPRARLPNYQTVDWADAHFAELKRARVEYHSFYGWRREPIEGSTITVDQRGIRPTPGSTTEDPSAPFIVFLGGSTMWGEGADNENTIPALFTRYADIPIRAENLGESAYNAFQSYLFLRFRIFDGWRPNLVISYDGFNNVEGLCRADNRTAGHGRENQMRNAMRGLDQPRMAEGLKPSWFVLPLKEIFSRFASKMDPERENPYRYVCYEDQGRAMEVARGLLDSWVTTMGMVLSHGGEFVAVLQPIAYLGTPSIDHLSLDPIQRREHETVYGLVHELLNTSEYKVLQSRFIDLTDSFDNEGYVYIDPVHLSPVGNDIVARRFLQTEQINNFLERYRESVRSGITSTESAV